MNNTEQINALVSCYQKAIHSQDKEEFYNLWARHNQCSLISITKKFIGIDAIYNDFLIGCIQKAYDTIDLITDNIDIHIISSDLAIVIFEYHTECIRRETKESYGIKGLETQLVIKENNEWKLVHVHYSK